MMKAKWIWLSLILLSAVIIAPPLMYGYIYPNGGDDSAFHMLVMQHLRLDRFYIPQSSIYAGQWIVGYPLKFLDSVIPITVSFTWFNYLALIGVVISNFFVFSKLFNRNVGLITALSSFLIVRTNIELFLAGSIFNVINMGIVLPWMLYFVAKYIIKREWKYLWMAVPLIVLFAVYHATGKYLFALIPLMGLAYWQRKRLETEGKTVIAIMVALSLVLFIMSLPIWHLSPDAGRQGVDAFGLILLVMVILLGWKMAVGKAFIPVTLLLVVAGSLYVLPTWFRYINAIQPVDKQAIEYIETLPDSTIYGNENFAYWVYQPYVKKEYMPKTGIYVWRSEPETARTTPSYLGYWNPSSDNVQQPLKVKSMKEFADDKVSIYVAEVIE